MYNSMGSEVFLHAFLISFPGQGHVNPLLRLGKRLASKGLFVTFTVPENLGHEMQKANKIVEGQANRVGDGYLRFQFFEDGLGPEDGPKRQDMDVYLPHLELVGKDIVSRMISKCAKEGLPVSCIINNPFIPWVSDVAESLGIPNAVLWVQSCACFAAYYHYYHNMIPFPTESELEVDVHIPHMPLLKHDEIPSFLHPTTPYLFLKRPILGQYRNLEKPFWVLMDTFDELEHEVIDYMSKFCPIKAVGPLFKEPKVSIAAVRADFVKAADDCIQWLDTKSASSVVYISFGSIVNLKQDQVYELANGLLSSGVSFLWVFKPPHPDFAFEPVVLPDEFLEKAGDRGKVVQWCPQEQVLAHPSVACFVTHCGWNSTMEALASGTPVVAFPQWGDQVTDAKYLVDVFKVGLRLSRGEAEKRSITREEIEKCLLEATSGPKALELKENALKWKKSAEEAIVEGGSSEKNLEEFVEEIRKKIVEMALKSRSNALINEPIEEKCLV